ncbi:MAG: hypothetical protein ACTIOQ_15080 [Serratia grimesii]|uniref:hypothetical protein n=1 Tax=Serratia grimesii TaxID=82995 RepID=UPI003F9E7880
MFNDYLRHICNTMFFMYQRSFNSGWDTRLNHLMNEGEIISVSRYRVTFSLHEQNYGVWVANRWYAFGHLDEVDGKGTLEDLQYRPRFSTMRRLNQLHVKAFMGELYEK